MKGGKVKNLFPAALLGALMFVSPVMGANLFDPNGGGLIEVGYLLSGGDTIDDSGIILNNYDLASGGIDINFQGVVAQGAPNLAAVYTDGSDGTFTLVDITIDGTADYIVGFLYASGAPVGPTPYTIFSGSINNILNPDSGTSITVTNLAGKATGIAFIDIENAPDFATGKLVDAEIRLGDITVTAKEEAFGWYSNEISGGTIILGDIVAKSTGSEIDSVAVGLFIEGGSDAALTVGDITAIGDLTQVFLRTGTDLRYQVKCFTFNSGIYYAYDVNNASLDTRVGLVADPRLNTTLAGTKLGNSLVTFNVGGEYQLARCWTVFGGYQGDYLTDSAANAMQSTAYVGTGLRW